MLDLKTPFYWIPDFGPQGFLPGFPGLMGAERITNVIQTSIGLLIVIYCVITPQTLALKEIWPL